MGSWEEGGPALLHSSVFRGRCLCVVASAVSVLRLVPVVRVFTLHRLPVPLPPPSHLLALLVLAVVAILFPVSLGLFPSS